MSNCTLTPLRLSCEYLPQPLGLTERAPRLSWIVTSGQRAQAQTAYQILVAPSLERLAADQGTLWDSGYVESDQTAHIPYQGRELRSGERCYWKVRVWDQAGVASPYSEPAMVQMGLLSPDDWQAQWIGIDPEPEPELGMTPGTYLRRGFQIEGPVTHATLYATAKGVYRPYLNGERAGDIELAPGWTDFRKRILVQAYDVTDLLHSGENTLGIVLADGWYSGYLGYQGIHRYYGSSPRALAQLVIAYADGRTETIVTDRDWRASTGPILYSDIQMGEAYDARREMPGWASPGFDDAAWLAVQVEPREPGVLLQGEPNQPIRVTQEIAPRSVTEVTPGVFIFDLGQNLAGWARLTVQGEAGTRIRLRFGEMLEPDGSLHTANLRSARVTDYYTLKGDGVEVYEPTFVYHGFRYVELTGYPGTPARDAILARVIHNDMPATGTFECSHPLVSQLWRNILWGQRSNFVSVPTDCPQRDERLGWTGDAQIFCRTASFNMDVAAFFTKWLNDMSDTQGPNGAFTDIAPQIAGMPEGAPAWGDAGIIIPWTLYRVYGDTRLIEQHYAAMQRWMAYIAGGNPLLLRTRRLNNAYSDWVALERPTSSEQVGTAYWAKIARMMAEMADAIGEVADAEDYLELYEEIRETFIAAYFHPDGRIEGGTQASYVLALDNDLLPERLRHAAARHLVEALARNGGHLATGFVGTPPLCFVLAEEGYLEEAYRLLTQETYPSWLYMILNGATTMWERWDAYTVEGGIHDPGMNSFNHYAYGSIAEWMYRVILGIDADEPGYRRIRLRPRPGGGLSYARGSYESIAGRIASAWKVLEDRTIYHVEVPANTTAELALPAGDPYTIREGGGLAAEQEGVELLRYEQGLALFELGSGSYSFTVPHAAGG